MQVRLRYLNSNIQHPNVVKTELTVITAKDIELSFDNIGGVSAPWSWSVVTCLHLVPMVLLDVKHVHIIHPMGSIIPSKVVNL